MTNSQIKKLPDEVLQPSALGLARKTDPVLAYAAIKFGANISPEQARGYYFMTQKDESDDEESVSQ